MRCEEAERRMSLEATLKDQGARLAGHLEASSAREQELRDELEAAASAASAVVR